MAGLGDGEGVGHSFFPPHPPHSARAVEMAKVAVASRMAARTRRRIEVLFMVGVVVLGFWTVSDPFLDGYRSEFDCGK